MPRQPPSLILQIGMGVSNGETLGTGLPRWYKVTLLVFTPNKRTRLSSHDLCSSPGPAKSFPMVSWHITLRKKKKVDLLNMEQSMDTFASARYQRIHGGRNILRGPVLLVPIAGVCGLNLKNNNEGSRLSLLFILSPKTGLDNS